MSDIKKFEKGEKINFNELQDNFTILEEKIGGGGSSNNLSLYLDENGKAFLDRNCSIKPAQGSISVKEALNAIYYIKSGEDTDIEDQGFRATSAQKNNSGLYVKFLASGREIEGQIYHDTNLTE